MKDNDNKIIVKDIIGSNKAVSSEKGEIVFKAIDSSLSQSENIILDFENIELMTTAFLNAAIGQLYSKYTGKQLNDHLRPINLQSDDKEMFIMVLERAKQFFADKKGFEDSANNSFYGK